MQKVIKWMAVIFAITLVFTLTTPTMAYENHCWNCGKHISSDYCDRCPECGWYICVNCGACRPGCSLSSNHTSTDNNTKSSDEYSTNSSSGSSSSYDYGGASEYDDYYDPDDYYYDDEVYEIYYDDVAVPIDKNGNPVSGGLKDGSKSNTNKYTSLVPYIGIFVVIIVILGIIGSKSDKKNKK